MSNPPPHPTQNSLTARPNLFNLKQAQPFYG